MDWLHRQDFWFAFAPLATAALGLLLTGLGFLRSSRLYQDTPTSRVRSAAQGYVELEGHAVQMPGDPVVAPLTGGRCCWFRCQVDYREEGHWTTIHRELSGALFHLRDASGHCVINPDGAQVLPSKREVWYGPLPRPPWGPRMGRGLLRRSTAKYRYTEERIDLDAPLYTLGLFQTHRGAEATEDPREQVRALMLRWKNDPRMMALFDRNGDGTVDGVEWEAARRMAKERVREQTLREMPGEDVPVLCRPPDSRPYLLSAVPQHQLIGQRRRRGLLCLGAALLAAAAAGSLLAARGFL